MTDDLTVDDFVENDLPYRPLKYRPRQHAEFQQFAVLSVGVFVLLFGVVLLL